MLVGEEADQESSGAFVSRGDEAVDPAMLSSDEAMGVLLAERTGTHMDNTLRMLHDHGYMPLW